MINYSARVRGSGADNVLTLFLFIFSHLGLEVYFLIVFHTPKTDNRHCATIRYLYGRQLVNMRNDAPTMRDGA